MAVKKTQNKPSLKKAEGPQRFWVKDGRILSDLRDLKDALAEMAEETYKYHANKIKNDFAKWIEEVLENKKLAEELKKVKTKIAALKKVAAELKKYQ